jgi:hypothetical protein
LPAERVGEPLGIADDFSREAAVQLRLDRPLEDLDAEEVSHVHADDPLGRHAPIPLIDRVDPLIPVIPADDGDAIGCALEHLPGQIFRPLALGDVHHAHQQRSSGAG